MDVEYLKEKRILLVDDEQGLLDMVCSILKEEGYRQIRTAGTVKEALAGQIAIIGENMNIRRYQQVKEDEGGGICHIPAVGEGSEGEAHQRPEGEDIFIPFERGRQFYDLVFEVQLRPTQEIPTHPCGILLPLRALFPHLEGVFRHAAALLILAVQPFFARPGALIEDHFPICFSVHNHFHFSFAGIFPRSSSQNNYIIILFRN